MLHIYSDGATLPTNPGPSAYGYVILREDHETILHEGFGMWQHSTNQRAELCAIVSAFEWLIKRQFHPQLITLYSDSQYAIKCLSEWWPKWERNGWQRRAKGKNEPVKNLDLIQRGVQAQKIVKVRFEWVRGHSGVRWNEYVDQMVNAAAGLALDEGEIDGGYNVGTVGTVGTAAIEQRDYERARLASLFD